jgi:hypothetical protein
VVIVDEFSEERERIECEEEVHTYIPCEVIKRNDSFCIKCVVNIIDVLTI